MGFLFCSGVPRLSDWETLVLKQVRLTCSENIIAVVGLLTLLPLETTMDHQLHVEAAAGNQEAVSSTMLISVANHTTKQTAIHSYYCIDIYFTLFRGVRSCATLPVDAHRAYTYRHPAKFSILVFLNSVRRQYSFCLRKTKVEIIFCASRIESRNCCRAE